MIPDFEVMRKILAREQGEIDCVIDNLKGLRLLCIALVSLTRSRLTAFWKPFECFSKASNCFLLASKLHFVGFQLFWFGLLCSNDADHQQHHRKSSM